MLLFTSRGDKTLVTKDDTFHLNATMEFRGEADEWEGGVAADSDQCECISLSIK